MASAVGAAGWAWTATGVEGSTATAAGPERSTTTVRERPSTTTTTAPTSTTTTAPAPTDQLARPGLPGVVGDETRAALDAPPAVTPLVPAAGGDRVEVDLERQLLILWHGADLRLGAAPGTGEHHDHAVVDHHPGPSGPARSRPTGLTATAGHRPLGTVRG